MIGWCWGGDCGNPSAPELVALFWVSETLPPKNSALFGSEPPEEREETGVGLWDSVSGDRPVWRLFTTRWVLRVDCGRDIGKMNWFSL